LGAVHEQMIGKHARHHRFSHRDGADSNAWIVPTFGGDGGIMVMHIDSFNRRQDRTGGLDAKRATTGCPVEIPPRMPPA